MPQQRRVAEAMENLAGDLDTTKTVPGPAGMDHDALGSRPSLLERLREQGVTPIQVAKVSPQQNGFIERFNGVDARLAVEPQYFHSLTEAPVAIDARVRQNNEMRTHWGRNAYAADLDRALCSAASHDTTWLLREMSVSDY